MKLTGKTIPAAIALCALLLAVPAVAEDTAVSTADGAAEAALLPETEITVFAAKSLNSVMEALAEEYARLQPAVKITGSYDSSGTLMTQIEEGAECDVFFSAALKQMNELEEKELLVPGTRKNLVNNQVCLVTYPGSGTKVTGLDSLGEASSMALADGSVPVGKYTREALISAGILPETEEASAVTTKEVSEALGGLEINECANVGACVAAVAEGSNEVGTVYCSDTHGFEEDLEILQVIPYELTGDVIYPAARVVNPEADEAQNAAAEDFLAFLSSDAAKEIFESFYFDTDVEP